MKVEAGPAALYTSKSVAVTSSLDRPCPSCQTSDSPRKLSGQPSSISKRKQRQGPTGSGNHHAVFHATKFALTKGCCFSAKPLKLHLAETFEIFLRALPLRSADTLYIQQTFEVWCLERPIYDTIAVSHSTAVM